MCLNYSGPNVLSSFIRQASNFNTTITIEIGYEYPYTGFSIKYSLSLINNIFCFHI